MGLTDGEKALVVSLILMGRVEEALEIVCSAHGRTPPKVRVGRVKGHDKALAVYDARRETIFVSRGEFLRNPFIILHETYHHLRMLAGRHRGTEKHADRFALSFIEAYLKLASRGGLPRGEAEGETDRELGDSGK